jgi:predicted transcriptional regulator
MPTSPSQTPSKIATFKLPADEWRRLEEVAEQDERSVSAVIRLAVRQYLDERQAA